MSPHVHEERRNRPAPHATAPERSRLRADGSREVLCLHHDTYASLYEAAFGDTAVTDGARPFAVWLLSTHGGLPRAGTLLVVPPHELMVKQSATMPAGVQEAARLLIPDGISYGHKTTRMMARARQTALASRNTVGLLPGRGGARLDPGATSPAGAKRIKLPAAEPYTGPSLRELHRAVLAHADYRPADWQTFGAALFRGREGHPRVRATALNGIARESVADTLRDALKKGYPALGGNELEAAVENVVAGMRRQLGNQFFIEVGRAAAAAVDDLRQAVTTGDDGAVVVAFLRLAGIVGPGNAQRMVDDLGLQGRKRLARDELRRALSAHPDVLSRIEDDATTKVTPEWMLDHVPGLVAAKAHTWGVAVVENPTVARLEQLQLVARFLLPVPGPGELADALLLSAAGTPVEARGSGFLAETIQNAIDREAMHRAVAEVLTWLLGNLLAPKLSGARSGELIDILVNESPSIAVDILDLLTT
jgi:hypothetical protein